MKDEKHSGDRVVALASSGAALGSKQSTDEQLGAKGVYTVVCRRANPGQEHEYQQALQRAAKVEQVGTTISRYVPFIGRKLTKLVLAKVSAMRDAANKFSHVLWQDLLVFNLVTDVGAKKMLDDALAASAVTNTCYLGLKGTGTAAVGDTQASHAGWSEVGGTNAPAYTGNRQSPTWAASSGTGAGSRSKATNSTNTFTFTSGGTVDGAFLNINGSATKDNTTGTLFSAGTFSGGSKTVASSDTLTVTYTLSL